MTRTLQTNRRGAGPAIARRESFTASALSGEAGVVSRYVGPGELPAAWAAALEAETTIVYVVRSYRTPILWVDFGFLKTF